MQASIRLVLLADEHAHLLLGPLPRKALVPLAARLWLKQVSEARKLVSANGQVRGCPAGKFHRKQHPVRSYLLAK